MEIKTIIGLILLVGGGTYAIFAMVTGREAFHFDFWLAGISIWAGTYLIAT